MGVTGHVLVHACLSNADEVVTATALILRQSREKYIISVFLTFQRQYSVENACLRMTICQMKTRGSSVIRSSKLTPASWAH